MIRVILVLKWTEKRKTKKERKNGKRKETKNRTQQKQTKIFRLTLKKGLVLYITVGLHNTNIRRNFCLS